MKATITRIKGGTALRTDSITGVCGEVNVGLPFVLIGEALEGKNEGKVRYLTTSPVVFMATRENGEVEFETKSGSVYRLVPA